jgi:hypothetical protein
MSTPPTRTAQLNAIVAALNAALAGDGFDGGDFTGLDPADFEAARDWAEAELAEKKPRRRPPVAPAGARRWTKEEFAAFAKKFKAEHPDWYKKPTRRRTKP